MSVGKPRKIFRLLIIGAPAQDGIVDDRVLDIDDDAGGRIDRGDLLDGQNALEEIAALSAVFFGDLDAHEAELEELAEQALVEDGASRPSRGPGARSRSRANRRTVSRNSVLRRLSCGERASIRNGMRQETSGLQAARIAPVLRFGDASIGHVAAARYSRPRRDRGALRRRAPTPLFGEFQQIGKGRVGEREGGGMRNGGGHVRNAIVEHVVDEVDGVGMGGGVGGFEAAALIDGDIHHDGAALHAGDHVAAHEFGGGGARNEHAADDQVGVLQGFRDGPGVGGEGDDEAVEDVVEFAQAVETAVDDGDVRAHADRDFGGIGADDAAAEDGHVRRRDAGDAAEQNAAAAVGTLQILRADLHGHASGDFAHGGEQRQRAVALDDGFVGDAGDAGIEQLIR